MKFTIMGYQVTVERTQPAPEPIPSPRVPPFPSTSVLRLPRAIANRDHVQKLFEDQRIPAIVSGAKFVVSGRDCLVMTEAAADELIRQALSRVAFNVYVVAMKPEWVEWLQEAARLYHVTDPAYVSRITAIEIPAESEWVKQ